MRIWRFTHNHCFLEIISTQRRRWGFGGSPTTICFSREKKIALPEMRVRRFTHNHCFLKKKSSQCRRWGFGGSPTTICFSKKKIALPEMRVRRFTHNHCFLKKKVLNVGDEGFKVHPQPLLSQNYKSQCGDEGLKVHPQPSLSHNYKFSMSETRVSRFTHNHCLLTIMTYQCRRWVQTWGCSDLETVWDEPMFHT